MAAADAVELARAKWGGDAAWRAKYPDIYARGWDGAFVVRSGDLGFIHEQNRFDRLRERSSTMPSQSSSSHSSRGRSVV